eukprot:m.36948 g.36948  ORF g.36948 m.36948 type:complete len:939 (+) comp32308_c0_seq5:103-2919(+)
MESDVCRVCRAGSSSDRPLYHPCVCKGSIKHIHQDCLVLWLRHSQKEYCELCKHRFSFRPIYSPNMPSRLPLTDIIRGFVKVVKVGIKFWLHYTLVTIAWLGVVPLTAWRVYKNLFTGNLMSLLSLPIEILSLENLLSDCVKGCFVVACTLCSFISLVWLREQVLQGGGPEWLPPGEPPGNHILAGRNGQPVVENEGQAVGGDGVDEVREGDDVEEEEAGRNELDASGESEQEEEGQREEGEESEEEGNADGVNVPGGAAFDGNPNQNVAANNENEDGDDEGPLHWNPVDFDRAADELTWDRMLGLDGSLAFLEHVFWVISLNTTFILLFAFFPYHAGSLLLSWSPSIVSQINVSAFGGLLFTLVGYVAIAFLLFFCYIGLSLFNTPRLQRLFGMLYTVLKVSLLMMVEVGIFPSVCGWWIDICSLDLFSHSLRQRLDTFRSAPGTAMVLHWMVGMVYIFYFASFVLLVREIIRPGVLWFLRNLNDPDFHPVQEMIQLPVYRHARRFLLSSIIFGMAILVIVWIPSQLILAIFPGFLPYVVNLSSESPMGELSLELILLQVILPAILEQKHTRLVMKGFIQHWIFLMANLLSLHSYLLGKKAPANSQQSETAEVPPQPVNGDGHHIPEAEVPVDQPLGEDAHAHLAFQPQERNYIAFEQYQKPSYFAIRVFSLVFLLCMSFVTVSVFLLTLPVALGRFVLWFWFGLANLHEVYTSAVGLYFMWLITRVYSALWTWISQGIQVVRDNMSAFLVKALKVIVAFFPLGIVIPFLLGLCVELAFFVPFRVPLYQTPEYFFIQDWAMGVLYLKLFCAAIMLGQNNRPRQVIEQVYHDGLSNLRLKFVLTKLALPVITVLLLILCVPYVITAGILPMTGISWEYQNFVSRRIYPYLFLVSVLFGVGVVHIRQLSGFFSHVRNDKYLVGQELVNYQGSGARGRTD